MSRDNVDLPLAEPYTSPEVVGGRSQGTYNAAASLRTLAQTASGSSSDLMKKMEEYISGRISGGRSRKTNGRIFCLPHSISAVDSIWRAEEEELTVYSSDDGEMIGETFVSPTLFSLPQIPT